MPGRITVIAWGSGPLAWLPAAALEALRRAPRVVVRTGASHSADDIARAVVDAAAAGDVVYIGGAPAEDPAVAAIANHAPARGVAVEVIAAAGAPEGETTVGSPPVGRVTFDELVTMMAYLRSPEGCPWDREQTHRSLRRYLLEEAYEAIDAIERDDFLRLRDELGDVLLQVLFHAQMASEAGEFAIGDVLAALARKLKSRHAHVWGDLRLDDADSVLESWERIKRREGGHEQASCVLADIPRILPALMRAQEISRKAARTGFDWSGVEGPLAKLEEEIAELRAALAKPSPAPEQVAREIGDLGIALINVARWVGVDAETAVREAADRFIDRFHHLEESARAQGRRLEEMSIEEMDRLWEEAKERRRTD